MDDDTLAAIEERLNDPGFCNLTPVTRADIAALLAEVKRLETLYNDLEVIADQALDR